MHQSVKKIRQGVLAGICLSIVTIAVGTSWYFGADSKSREPDSDANEYLGSSFDEVKSVIEDRTLPQDALNHELRVYQAKQLPQYEVSARVFMRRGVNLLAKAAQRTVSDQNDYYPRLEKFVHPNGICLSGEWKITEENIYSGFFSKGSRALFIGRVSSALSRTTSAFGSNRSFGFAGKIFPTLDSNEKVKTANFFTINALAGTTDKLFSSVSLSNEPPRGNLLTALPVISLGLKIAEAFKPADANPGFRPLWPIAELGLENHQVVKVPTWMRISPSANNAIIEASDFRDELNLKKTGNLIYQIAVSDTTKDMNSKQGWKTIGSIEFTESFVSYGCDRQLHFAHPKLVKP